LSLWQDSGSKGEILGTVTPNRLPELPNNYISAKSPTQTYNGALFELLGANWNLFGLSFSTSLPF